MTQISVRVYQLAEYETITGEGLDQALADAAGRVFAVRIDGRMYEARAVDAFVRDDWIVVTTEINADVAVVLMDEYQVGPLRVVTLLDEAWAPPLRPVVTPSEPDWSTAPGAFGGPARFEWTLDQGLGPVADRRWWHDRMCDSAGEWLAGPEFRWVSP